ncbi:MAG: hypothetical protein K2L95_00065 [Alphaproteobacteria bacterium]|nr:hypothetical protein [Alphaproteobacteria bacterium]
MKKISISLLFGLIPVMSHATSFPSGTPTVMSKYGQIQNVQNYSSNPFWSPDAPYNQRMPVPVYVQGADLNAGDCMTVVNSLIASQCASRNHCLNTQLSDVRPAIMLQLSRMPGHNYASSCAGYIDTLFADYVAQYRVTTPSGGAAFPTGTIANPNINQPTYQMANPYQPRVPGSPGDPWGQGIIDRATEMKRLQAQNGSGTSNQLAAAAFPTTIADVSFTERMENKAAGYEPYKDASAYQALNIESDETYWAREQQKMEFLKQTNYAEWCRRMPTECAREKQGAAASATTATTTTGGGAGQNQSGGTGAQPVSAADRQALIDKIISAFPK